MGLGVRGYTNVDLSQNQCDINFHKVWDTCTTPSHQAELAPPLFLSILYALTGLQIVRHGSLMLLFVC